MIWLEFCTKPNENILRCLTFEKKNEPGPDRVSYVVSDTVVLLRNETTFTRILRRAFCLTCCPLKGSTAAMRLDLAESFFSFGKSPTSSPNARIAFSSRINSTRAGKATDRGGMAWISFADRSST